MLLIFIGFVLFFGFWKTMKATTLVLGVLFLMFMGLALMLESGV